MTRLWEIYFDICFDNIYNGLTSQNWCSFPTGNGSEHNTNGGRIMMYVRRDIPANSLATENAPLEGLYVELNLRNAKWLFIVHTVQTKRW